jgi:phosphorylcholine metabolism protein LicD
MEDLGIQKEVKRKDREVDIHLSIYKLGGAPNHTAIYACFELLQHVIVACADLIFFGGNKKLRQKLQDHASFTMAFRERCREQASSILSCSYKILCYFRKHV